MQEDKTIAIKSSITPSSRLEVGYYNFSNVWNSLPFILISYLFHTSSFARYILAIGTCRITHLSYCRVSRGASKWRRPAPWNTLRTKRTDWTWHPLRRAPAGTQNVLWCVPATSLCRLTSITSSSALMTLSLISMETSHDVSAMSADDTTWITLFWLHHLLITVKAKFVALCSNCHTIAGVVLTYTFLK